MDLISRKAAIEALEFEKDCLEALERINGVEDAIEVIQQLPSVAAVPLDKLCEWLNVHCGRPNYCNDRLCGECNLDGEGFEYEPCWKTLLTEWMEEQDAAD
jgi:hypothetical protein